MNCSAVVAKMTAFYRGDQRDIAHFLKVYALAKTLGELERLDAATRETLELAAIVHDIACPLCREKYGNAAGHLQEAESGPLLREFLAEFDLPEAVKERAIALVCRHHTYTDVDGMDCRLLLEADWLVNAGESETWRRELPEARRNVFRSSSGLQLLDSMFPE